MTVAAAGKDRGAGVGGVSLAGAVGAHGLAAALDGAMPEHKTFCTHSDGRDVGKDLESHPKQENLSWTTGGVKGEPPGAARGPSAGGGVVSVQATGRDDGDVFRGAGQGSELCLCGQGVNATDEALTAGAANRYGGRALVGL